MHAPSSGSFLEQPFLGRGFRPFFLLAALYGVAGLLLWVGSFQGWTSYGGAIGDGLLLHAHEMIYGFTVAVISGFLLTAVANWTGGAPVRQLQLLLLGLLWCAGRIVMNIDGLPLLAVAVVDCSFLPLLAVSLAVPLLRSRNTRNFIFLGLLGALFACNVAFFVMQDRQPLYIAMLIVLTMISLVGGRIIPAFTVASLRRMGITVRQQDQPLLDRLCLASMIFLALAFLFGEVPSFMVGVAAFAAAFVHLFRFFRYHPAKAVKDPMLWILHAGYLWLCLGLALIGFAGWGAVNFTAALHALTVGCIGSMCIGMMSRVTLGHTGREILAPSLTVASFALMQGAAVLRVAGPEAFPEHYLLWIMSSGVLWAVSFGLYVIVYAPMLVRARPDGLPA